MTNFFKKAISNLSVASINIRKTSVSIHDFVENYDFSLLEKEGYKGVEKVKLVRSEADGDDQKKIWWEFHFFYSVGVRLVDESSKESEENNNAVVEITATFNAIYKSDVELEKECIEAFSENNVGYHVWPYWREFVQSCCARADIDNIEIPVYTFEPK